VAYQALARSWRPKSFADLKGQEHVTRALMNAISRNQLHHAYLFTGTRGVGKTTIARILAKALNCEQGIMPEPCGVCTHCVAIDAGRFVDLIEVDAASRTRVEDTRDLLENVQYAPTQGRFKIYLIDEVHMLSGHSFNALLKTLEEPPAHVKFILATTDPQRIPPTVLSRCLRFNLRALSTNDITQQLQTILTAEKITFEPAAIQIIARAGAGSMRDALSVLEQGISYGNGTLQTHDIESMLGMHYQRYLPELLNAIGALNVQNALAAITKMAEVGADFEQVLASVLQALHEAAIARVVPQEDPNSLTDALSPEENQLLYQIGLNGQRDLAYAPDPRSGFEMVLLRMMVFRPAFAQVAPPVAEKVVAPKPIAPVPAAPITTPKPVAPVIVAPTPVPAPAPVMPPAASATQTSTSTPIDWPQLIAQLPLAGLARTLVKNCVVSQWNGEQLMLILEETQKACLNPPRQAQIQEALSKHFGRHIKLTITAGTLTQASPHQQAQAVVQERQAQVKQSLEQDPIMQALLTTFDATVEKVTALDPENTE
jgi:DNA polymerase-3 subunit gamma/tau